MYEKHKKTARKIVKTSPWQPKFNAQFCGKFFNTMWKTLCKTRPNGAEKWLFRRVLHTFNRVFNIKME